MTKAHKICFDNELLVLIADNKNDKAKSILSQDLINAFDDFGTLLHYAAAYGNTAIAQHLIDIGSQVDSLTKDRKTPLMLALQRPCSATVKVLLEAGARIDIVSGNGESVLRIALYRRYSDSEIIQAIVRKAKMEADSVERFVERLLKVGYALPHFLFLRDVKILKMLLQRGSDINVKDRNGETALHQAIDLGDFELVKILVDHDADVNALDDRGFSPLIKAATRRNAVIIQLLIQQGANASYKNRLDGCTPLLALFNGQTDDVEELDECAAILLQHRAFPQDVGPEFTIILGHALNYSKSKVIGFMIAHLTMLETIEKGTSRLESIESCRVMQDSSINEYRRLASIFVGSMIADIKVNCKRFQTILMFAFSEKVLLLDLLADSEYKMRLRVRNETFVSKVKDFCSEKKLSTLCLYYYKMLMGRIAKASRVIALEDKAMSVICDIFQKNENECYVAAREIFRCLDERDLQQLCRV